MFCLVWQFYISGWITHLSLQLELCAAHWVSAVFLAGDLHVCAMGLPEDLFKLAVGLSEVFPAESTWTFTNLSVWGQYICEASGLSCWLQICLPSWWSVCIYCPVQGLRLVWLAARGLTCWSPFICPDGNLPVHVVLGVSSPNLGCSWPVALGSIYFSGWGWCLTVAENLICPTRGPSNQWDPMYLRAMSPSG